MTKEEIIEKVKKHILSIDLRYEEAPIICHDKTLEKLRDHSLREVYVVSFKTTDKIKYNAKGEIISLVEGRFCFCYVAADTYEILFYLAEHGYIEPNGNYHSP